MNDPSNRRAYTGPDAPTEHAIDSQGLHHIAQCGCCSCFHASNFGRDCREDQNRYAGPDEYAERNGISEDKVVVDYWAGEEEADGEDNSH